jgi:hypothetical protein
MCSINHNLKALFIHIPKNGGSYIAEILSKHYGFKNYYLQRPDHRTFCSGKDYSVDKHENKLHGTLIYYKTSSYLNKIMNMNEEKWKSYFIFSFIRNPYDRIISGWNYCIYNNINNINFEKYLSFSNIINSYDYWHVFMSQWRHLVDTDGKININFIGSFENLENDLKSVLNQIGYNDQQIIHIPFKKNSKKHNDYKSYYKNNDILTTVNKLMEEDFKNFNYKKIDNILDL